MLIIFQITAMVIYSRISCSGSSVTIPDRTLKALTVVYVKQYCCSVWNYTNEKVSVEFSEKVFLTTIYSNFYRYHAAQESVLSRY